MSAFSFSGLASGLDSATLINQLVQLRRTPITRLENRNTGYNKEIAALAALKTKMIALQEAALRIDTPSEFAALKGTSSDEDILRVTASGTAAPGNYEIIVTALAKGQKSVSQGYDTSADAVGSGTLVITVGGVATSLTIEAGTTLSQLAATINREMDGVGASVIYDGSAVGGYRLAMNGAAGADNAFTVDTSGLSGGLAPTFTDSQAASNAALTVDGIPITASGNELTDVISGLTIDLRSADLNTTVQVEVSMDASGVSGQVQAFVDAYNAVFSFLKTTTAKGGDLDGNASARSVGSRLESVMSATNATPGSRFTILSQVGIERTRERTLTFDTAAFSDAIEENFASVRDLFVDRDDQSGKAGQIDELVHTLTDSVSGFFKIGTDSLNRKIESADSAIERYERSLENYRTTLERKYLAMELQVGMLQAQSSSLSAMQFYNG
jgi:flagellar hook-associated protein 2